MKKSIFYGIVSIMIACLTVSTLQTNAQKKDEDAIKKVIQEETSAFFHKNYDGWANTWAHDTAATTFRAGANGYSQLIGWNTIAAQYKTTIDGLPMQSDAEIAPLLRKTDYQIYINGNMATVTFKDGNKTPFAGMRTLVKQNGTWKILNVTSINNSSYAMANIMGNMKAFVGKWVLDGKATMEPSEGGELNSLQFELKQTLNGLEQLSTAVFSNNSISYAPPVECEYFIPDYNTNTVSYMDISKNSLGQTFPKMGTVTSDKPNSFTVTVMYPDKPTAKQDEYTVTMENGKWHQVGKSYDRNGKQIRIATVDLHRL